MITSKPQVFLVVVMLKYLAEGYEAVTRPEHVRVLAFDEIVAQDVAITYAETLPRPHGYRPGPKPKAVGAWCIMTLTPVDCIAQSILDGR